MHSSTRPSRATSLFQANQSTTASVPDMGGRMMGDGRGEVDGLGVGKRVGRGKGLKRCGKILRGGEMCSRASGTLAGRNWTGLRQLRRLPSPHSYRPLSNRRCAQHLPLRDREIEAV